MKQRSQVSVGEYVGLFLVCLSLLAFELLLTRIFSVALWYHFAFFVISIALFGLGAAGIVVQIFPKWFPEETLYDQLSLFCLCLGLTILFPTFLLLRIPLPVQSLLNLSGHAFVILCAIFIICSIPFFFGGLVTSLLFRRFPGSISKLYFADLLGASTGCLFTFFLVEWIEAPTALLTDAALASLGGFCFLKMDVSAKSQRSLFLLRILVPCFLLALAGYHHVTSGYDLKFAKGFDRSGDEFSKWNTISRVAVFDCKTKAPAEWIARAIWGVSQNFHGSFPEMKCLDIDAQAGTFLTRFEGDWKKVAYVQQDPPSLVHRLKEHPETLIIGAGGGKDVLAALSLGANHVTAVELNPIIVNDVMLRRYKEFTGGLYENQRVSAVTAEGRSYLMVSRKTYDIIQLAFVDTSAATSAGGYVLAENNLYTVDAFTEYLSHLNKEGIFSVSWTDVPGLYGGTRLVSLGIAALERLGVKDIRQHLMVVTHAPRPDWVIRTILLKRTPFTKEEQDRVGAACRELGFRATYLPDQPGETSISKLILHSDRKRLYQSLPIDISPTTDDRPFFFYQDRLSNWLKAFHTTTLPGLTYGVGLQLLSRLVALTFLLVCIFLIGPMFLLPRSATPTIGMLPYLLYFSGLGLGFMFLEIALLQKFVLFLGHPFYTLSTTLFSLLLFAGLGSLLTQRFSSRPPRTYIVRSVAALILLVLGYRWGLPYFFRHFMGSPGVVKVALTVLSLMPLALLMGMPLPLGIKAVHAAQMRNIIPWVWGLNGGTSVLGSILAMVAAMNFGYNATFMMGAWIYFSAFMVAALFFQRTISSKEL